MHIKKTYQREEQNNFSCCLQLPHIAHLELAICRCKTRPVESRTWKLYSAKHHRVMFNVVLCVRTPIKYFFVFSINFFFAFINCNNSYNVKIIIVLSFIAVVFSFLSVTIYLYIVFQLAIVQESVRGAYLWILKFVITAWVRSCNID